MLSDLRAMRDRIIALCNDIAPEVLDQILPENRTPGVNLIQYLAFREGDYRQLQDRLTEAGLSSLRASESHSLHSINQVIRWLDPADVPPQIAAINGQHARAIQEIKKCALFNSQKTCPDRFIMVTMDASHRQDAHIYADLINAGMNCARINTGHDGLADWKETIATIRKASEKTEKECAIYLDLSGPKIRITQIFNKIGESKQKLKLESGKKICIAEKFKSADLPGLPTLEVGIEGLFQNIGIGQKILFDDGVVSATTLQTEGDQIIVEIDRVKGGERKIKPANGIAFPGLAVECDAITSADRIALESLANEIDIVGISFVQRPEDVRSIIEMIHTNGWKHLGVVAKIETLSAFNRLPEILLSLMEIPRAGVMIARGDLALEVGMERMAEVQEEILWLCEAAMLPVIWATQVLESLTKLGIPTRAEISDAAMAVQAECVMLNKGPYVFDSVTSLSGILKKMRSHHNKKASEMRSLELARRYFSGHKKGGAITS